MKNYIYVIWLIVGSPSFLFSQPNDLESHLLHIEKQFSLYESSNDSDMLFSIGCGIPVSFLQCHENKHSDIWLLNRNVVTNFYFEWLAKALDRGLDPDYNPDDPSNTWSRGSLIFTGHEDEREVHNQKLKKNEENLRKFNLFYAFNRAMDRFRYFYKWGYAVNGYGVFDLEKELKVYATETNMDIACYKQIVEIIKIELKKKCTFGN